MKTVESQTSIRFGAKHYFPILVQVRIKTYANVYAMYNIYEKQVNGLLPYYLIQIENTLALRLRMELALLKK